jgi:hypothetical protein
MRMTRKTVRMRMIHKTRPEAVRMRPEAVRTRLGAVRTRPGAVRTRLQAVKMRLQAVRRKGMRHLRRRRRIFVPMRTTSLEEGSLEKLTR